MKKRLVEKKYIAAFHNGPNSNDYKEVIIDAENSDEAMNKAYKLPQATSRRYSNVTVIEYDEGSKGFGCALRTTLIWNGKPDNRYKGEIRLFLNADDKYQVTNWVRRNAIGKYINSIQFRQSPWSDNGHNKWFFDKPLEKGQDWRVDGIDEIYYIGNSSDNYINVNESYKRLRNEPLKEGMPDELYNHLRKTAPRTYIVDVYSDVENTLGYHYEINTEYGIYTKPTERGFLGHFMLDTRPQNSVKDMVDLAEYLIDKYDCKEVSVDEYIDIVEGRKNESMRKKLKESKDYGFSDEEIKEYIDDMQQEGIDPWSEDFKAEVKDYCLDNLFEKRDALNLWKAIKEYTSSHDATYTVFDAVYSELINDKTYKGKYVPRTKSKGYGEDRVDIGQYDGGYTVTVYGNKDSDFKRAQEVATAFKLKNDGLGNTNSRNTEFIKKFTMYIPDDIALVNADEYLA